MIANAVSQQAIGKLVKSEELRNSLDADFVVLILYVLLFVPNKKATSIFTCKWLILRWAQQDLNLWPADYESAALTV